MIPVGTLCVVINDPKYPQIIGMQCTVLEHLPPGETFDEDGNFVECVIDLDVRLLGGSIEEGDEVVALFRDLLPISPDSTITREEQREVVV